MITLVQRRVVLLHPCSNWFYFLIHSGLTVSFPGNWVESDEIALSSNYQNTFWQESTSNHNKMRSSLVTFPYLAFLSIEQIGTWHFVCRKSYQKKTSLNHSAACKRSCRNIGGVFFLKTLPNSSAGRDVHQGTTAPSDPLCALLWVLVQFHNAHRMDVSALTHTMSTQQLGCATPYNISLEASVGLTYSENVWNLFLTSLCPWVLGNLNP